MNKSDAIYFPRTIPMAFIRDKKFTWQDNVNGGAVSIADLNIVQQSFMGGNVIKLGWMNEYGMYACPNMNTQDIVALYIHDPSKVTEYGKALVRSAFPNNEVIFDVYKEPQFTEEDRRKLYEDKEYAVQQGLPPEMVTHATSEELKSLIKARASGKSETAGAIEVPVLVEPAEKGAVEFEHLGGSLPKTFLAGKPQPSKNRNGRK